jgi:hypothetical protein
MIICGHLKSDNFHLRLLLKIFQNIQIKHLSLQIFSWTLMIVITVVDDRLGSSPTKILLLLN